MGGPLNNDSPSAAAHGSFLTGRSTTRLFLCALRGALCVPRAILPSLVPNDFDHHSAFFFLFSLLFLFSIKIQFLVGFWFVHMRYEHENRERNRCDAGKSEPTKQESRQEIFRKLREAEETSGSFWGELSRNV